MLAFSKRVSVPDFDPETCWPWTGYVQSSGYGDVWWDGRVQGAHRVAWQLAEGRPIPPGKIVLHLCDYRPCCRPSHLRVGTHRENMDDMVSKGRNRCGSTGRLADSEPPPRHYLREPVWLREAASEAALLGAYRGP